MGIGIETQDEGKYVAGMVLEMIKEGATIEDIEFACDEYLNEEDDD